MTETAEMMGGTATSAFPCGRGDARTSEAQGVRDELAEALLAHGITLFSLRVDPVEHGGHSQVPLIDLGRCKLATARRLTALLSSEPRADGGGSAGPMGPARPVGTVGKGQER